MTRADNETLDASVAFYFKNWLDFEINILERDHHVQNLKGHYLGSYFHTGIESAPGPVRKGECGQIEKVRL